MNKRTPGAVRCIDVAAGIIWREGRFLGACRPMGRDFAGYWEFPGGKCENGECPGDALLRELTEELGITARAAAFWQMRTHWYPEKNFEVRLHFFHVTDFSGEPHAVEGQTLRWVHPAEAARLNFLPADEPVVAQLCAGASPGA